MHSQQLIMSWKALLLLLFMLLLSILLTAAHHEGPEVGVGSAQLVHDPLDLAKAKGPPLPVLAIQRHIGSIYQGLHRPMLLQPCLNHTTKILQGFCLAGAGGGGGGVG